MKVVLLLAGKGTRFLPLTEVVPKPLIPVAGAPVLQHILATFEQLDVEELIIIAGYLSEQIVAYMEANYRGAYRVVQQDRLDGTGGAVYAAREHIDCPVLVVFGDTIVDADLSRLNGNSNDNIIWTRAVEDFQRFGIVQADADGNMREIVEKPQVDVGRNANIGLYYIADHAALLAGLDRVMAGPAIKGEYYFTYALNDMVKHGRTIRVAAVDGWHDCGNLTALIETNRHFLTKHAVETQEKHPGVTLIHPVLIQDRVYLKDCRIGPNVTIEAGCRVVSSTLSETIVARNCNLENVILSGSLVGEGQSLAHAHLEGSIVANGKTTKAT
jgi:glucose-1-phosphate thymidylyltransferase